MDYNILSNIYQYFSLHISSAALKCFFIFCFLYLAWRLCIYIQEVVTFQSGIHYVNLERKSLQMFTSYNPFYFEANYITANYSGIKCVLKSQQSCYVQAFWGVPISSLFELLYGSWQSLIDSVTTDIPGKKFSTKCICANDSFILLAGEEKTVEFRPPLNISETDASQEEVYMRKVYPFVVLMILKENDEMSESVVVAMASAVHIPDTELLLSPQLIGQYIKLSSGHIGQIKKIFLSSPATSDDDEGYDLCLACYHRPVSMVFLPCCHACLCSSCFDLCKKCPVCRITSLYYFELPDVHRREAH